MNISLLQRLAVIVVLLCAASAIHAEGPPAANGPSDEAESSASAQAGDSKQDSDHSDSSNRHSRFDRHYRAQRWNSAESDGRHGNDLVSIGHDSTLPAGHEANAVVSILGSSTNEGDAVGVVSVLGNTRVTGTVREDAVSVLGNTFIDGKVEGDAVAVVGDVELGPDAEIGGDAVAVFGTVRRDPAAIVHGGVKGVFSGDFGGVAWLRTWIEHCLLYLRPLALIPGLAWAWGLALGFLAFYAFLALLFRDSISRCVQTLETQPGRSLLAAIIAMLLSPALIVLLCITVIGIAAVPLVAAAYLCIGLFGRAVMLAWLGSRIAGNPSTGPLRHPALAVLLGGAVVLLCYIVPVLGFLVYQLLGILGFGTVLYTLILAARAHQAAKDQQFNQTAAAFGSSGISSSSNAPSTGSSTAPPNGAAPFPAEPAAAAAPAAAAPTAASPHVTASMPRAGFWIRMAALFLDVLLVGFVMSVLHHVVHLHLLVLAAYGAVMWKVRGSTIGGIVFDLKVVRLDGRPVDWETAIVRALGCFLSLAVAGLGFIWIAFDDAHQAWHDKIAGTVVVRVPKGAPIP